MIDIGNWYTMRLIGIGVFMRLSKDLVGVRFSRLLVRERAPSDKWSNPQWLCVCDCGGEVIASGGNLRKRNTRSCGCLAKDNQINKTHGMSKTPIYNVWRAMINRCYNKKQRMYPRYGGRGVTVCDEWRQSFEKFYADMGDAPESYDIDRIDNNGAYCLKNCQWVTPKENARNKSNSKRWYVDGVMYKTTTEAAVKYDVARVTIERWCKGRTDTAKATPPKANCWVEKVYA